MSNLWKNLCELRRNPTNVQTQPADPEPATTAAARKSDDEGLASLVDMQQAMIAQMHVDIHDMTEHFKQQDQQLLEQEDEIKRLKEMPSIIEYDRFELEYWRNVYHEQQDKFLALYFHTCNMADDKEAMIEEAEKKKQKIKQQEFIIKQLKDKVAYLVHEDNLEHLARQQSITTYSSSDTASVASRKDDSQFQDKNSEIDTASVSSTTRESQNKFSIDARRQDQTGGISRMLNTVNRLARHYSPPDRYENSSTIIDPSESRSGPVKMFSWVHTEMLAMWVYAVKEVVTPEEEEQYNKFLQKQLRPPPIHSPHLPKAYVNWNRLNPGQFRNLPAPSKLRVSGCSPNPNFYLEKEPRRKEYTVVYVPKWTTVDYPFGMLYGFITNMGAVSVPDQPVHGYRCCEKTGVWMIDAKG